jgi:hypothetical protein
MNKSETITNLVKATVSVMKEVKGIDKTMTIGSGANSYKGVPDQEVKKVIGESMAKNGLSIFTTNIEESTQIDQWDVSYNGNSQRKQQVFTKVKGTYLLCHESDEWIEIQGIGHGIDSQDKSAGKASTYALKNALLYAFLVPTGRIDDTDVTHSDDIPVPPKSAPKVPEAPAIKMMTDKQFEGIKKLLLSVDNEEVKKGIKNFELFKTDGYSMSEVQQKELQILVDTL